MLRSLIGAALLAVLLSPQTGAAATTTAATSTAATSPSRPIATYCPRPLHRATRLIVVTVPSMTAVQATLHTFERKTPADAQWLRSGPPESAVVGSAGIGWSDAFVHLAKKDEPIKHEGDKRTPAGIFRVAGPFGFETSRLSGYTKLAAGNSFCVEDPASRLYGRIVDKRLAKAVKASEDMSAEPALKRGLIIDYPVRRGAKAGSCVFVHIWSGNGAGTDARIGIPEDRITVLQNWSAQGFTAIAIVSEEAVPRFKSCLPLNAETSKVEPPAQIPEPDPRRAHKDQRAELGR